MWPFTQIKSLFSPPPHNDPKSWLTGDAPSRGDPLSEKMKGSVRMPAFLPWFDELQNVGETTVMRNQYRKMLSCPNVKPALLGKLMAVMGLDLKIQPASDHARHKEHAEFIEWNLTKRLSGGVPTLIWNILVGACIDGFSVNEKVWSIQDGDDSRWRLKRVLRALKPKDVNQDLVLNVDEFKNVVSIMGLRFNAGEIWSPKDFLIYSHLPLFGTPLGMSDFRAAYSRYWMLDTVMKLRAMGAEKRAFPIIWGEYPDPTKQTQLEKTLSNIKFSNWFAVPKDTRMQAMEIAGTSSEYFASFRKDCQEDIFLGIQGATLQSLTGGAGQQRGASIVHKDTADLFKWHLSEVICNLLNDHENGLIQDMLVGSGNYRDVGELPTATLTGVDDAELAESMRIDQGLTQLGWKHSKKELAKTYGRKLPEDPEDELQPPAGGQGGGDQFSLDALLGGAGPDDEPIKPPQPKNRVAEHFSDAVSVLTPRVKPFTEDDPQSPRDLHQEIKSLLHTKVSAADVREMAKKLGSLSGAELDDLKRKLGIKAGGTIAQTAGKIAAHLKSPTFGCARVQVKHLLRNTDDPEEALPHLETLLRKLSPGDQEKLAAAHKMDTANFVYKPKEIARHIVDRAKGAV